MRQALDDEARTGPVPQVGTHRQQEVTVDGGRAGDRFRDKVVDLVVQKVVQRVLEHQLLPLRTRRRNHDTGHCVRWSALLERSAATGACGAWTAPQSGAER